jgi:hypothetical protein
MELNALAREVAAHAEAHYDEGCWDIVCECYTLAEIEEFLARQHALSYGAMTVEEAIAEFDFIRDVWADRRADARNSAF